MDWQVGCISILLHSAQNNYNDLQNRDVPGHEHCTIAEFIDAFNMRLAEQSDSEVFEAMRSGNLYALDVFYDRYGDNVYRLGLRILQSSEEAADLTHDIFLTLWRDVTYDRNRGPLIALLTVMARSRAINRLRQIKSQQRLAERWGRNTMTVTANKHPFLEELSLEETSQQIRDALQGIPENQR